MWQKENINEPAENSLQDEYIKIMKSAQKGKDSNIYLYFQIMFMVTIVVVSFALKYGNNETFQFAKDNYIQIFEKDNFSESTFSYKTIMDKMYEELQYRYGQLVTVICHPELCGT